METYRMHFLIFALTLTKRNQVECQQYCPQLDAHVAWAGAVSGIFSKIKSFNIIITQTSKINSPNMQLGKIQEPWEHPI